MTKCSIKIMNKQQLVYPHNNILTDLQVFHTLSMPIEPFHSLIISNLL
jgi:uncharacterized ubiquitin-like protein YukD